MDFSTHSSHTPVTKGMQFLRGFSLVEILVVIVIIAVLAVLIIPAANRMVASAHTAKCASNLKQLGVGITLYAGDHNGSLPPGQDQTYVNGQQTGIKQFNNSFSSWPYQYIQEPPYVYYTQPNGSSWSGPGQLGIFFCPADRNTVRSATYWIYAYNYCLFVIYRNGQPVAYPGDTTGNPNARYIKLSEAANKILLVDGIDMVEAKSWADGAPHPNANSNGVNAALTWGGARRVISSRHHGMANFLYGDGSVRLMKKTDIGQWDIERDRE